MENPPSNKTQALKKSVNMDIGVIGKSFFIRSSYTPFQFRKNSGKTSLRWVNFVFPILLILILSAPTHKMVKRTQIICRLFDNFVGLALRGLTLGFDRAVLYGNASLSITVLSIIKRYSCFLKKVFVFLKT